MRPPDFVLFLDENLHNCQPILNILGRALITYERHGDHFAPGTPDDVWLPVLGKRRWALLTTDRHIRTRHLERLAVQTNEVAMFCFTGKVAGAAVLAAALDAALPSMQKLIREHFPPFIATVTKGGEVNLREGF